MRPIHEIAQDVHACATAWVPEARLVGNVRADEIAYLAEYAMAADLGLARSSTIKLVPEGVAALEARIRAGYVALQNVADAAREYRKAQAAYGRMRTVQGSRDLGRTGVALQRALDALDDLAEPRRPTDDADDSRSPHAEEKRR